MRDYLSLGTTPCEEDCVQVGTENYLALSRAEAKRFITLLEKLFPESEGMYRIKSHPHDFGSYLDVEIMFDDENEDQQQIAFDVEGSLPDKWE